MKKTILTTILTLVITHFFAQSDIVITEIMYNPPESGTDSLEFIELYNTGTNAVNLQGYSFSQGVTYTFPNVTLNPGDFIVVCEDSMSMFWTFGVNAYTWTGALTNTGEDIVLIDGSANIIDSVNYDDFNPWPLLPDGQGHSLVLCDPNDDNALAASWGNSADTVVGVTINGYQLVANPMQADNCLPCAPQTYTASGTICQGDSIFLGGLYQTVAATYADTFPASTGCDSIINTTLTVNTPSAISASASICQGDSILLQGMYQTIAATYVDTFGCDSIVTTILTVDSLPTSSNAGSDQMLCDSTLTTLAGNTPLIGTGMWTVVSGTATITTPSSETTGVTGLQSPDSVTLAWTITSGACPSSSDQMVITVNTTSTTIDSITICTGDSVLVGGAYQTMGGVYTDTLTNLAGCDSIISTALKIEALPIANAGPDTTICTISTITLSGMVSGGAFSGVWSSTGTGTFSPDSTALNADYRPSDADTTAGSVMLILTANGTGACASVNDTVVITFIPCSSVEISKVANIASWKIYPNPTNDEFSVYLGNIYENAQVQVYNVLGESVGYQTNAVNASKVNIDLMAEPNGVYFVKVDAGHRSKTFRLLLAK